MTKDTKINKKHNNMASVLERTPKLIRSTYWKLSLPGAAAKICVLLVVLVDSLIASMYYGTQAIAAIAFLSPFFLFANVLHDIFVSGVMSVITRYKSVGEKEKANRGFGAILATQMVGFALIYGVIFILRWPILTIFTDDQTLLNDAMGYFVPYLIYTPILEAGLCLERGLRTDGRAKFFALSGPITVALNLIFNLLVVLVFDGGVRGLSIASGISGFLGYCWSASHLFSKKCTLRPDFSVVFKWKEFRGYIKEEMEIGTSFALQDAMISLVGFVMNKTMLDMGGAFAIAAYGIMTSVCSVLDAINMTIRGTFYQLSEMLYSDRDVEGVKSALSVTLENIVVVSILFVVACALFPTQIGLLFNAKQAEVINLLTSFLILGSIYSGVTHTGLVFENLFIVAKKNRLVKRFGIVSNALIIGGIILGAILFGIKGIFFGEIAAAIIVLASKVIVLKSSKILSQNGSRKDLETYSYKLSEEIVGEISIKIYDLFRSEERLYSSAPKASLMTEECNFLLSYFNSVKGTANVNVDLRVSVFDDSYCITVIDDGVIFNPIAELEKDDNPDFVNLSAKLLDGISPKANYSRIVDLNISHLVFEYR